MKKFKRLTGCITIAALLLTAVPISAVSGTEPTDNGSTPGNESVMPDNAKKLTEGDNTTSCLIENDDYNKTIFCFTPDKTADYQLDVSGLYIDSWGATGFYYFQDNEQKDVEIKFCEDSNTSWSVYPLTQGITYYVGIDVRPVEGYETEKTELDCMVRIDELIAGWGGLSEEILFPGETHDVSTPHCTVTGNDKAHEIPETIYDIMEILDPSIAQATEENGQWKVKGLSTGSTYVNCTASATCEGEEFKHRFRIKITVTDKKYYGELEVDGFYNVDYYLLPDQKLQLTPILTYWTQDPEYENVETTVSSGDYEVSYELSPNTDNENAVTMDQTGLVQAHSVGSCQISASFKIDCQQVAAVSNPYIYVRDTVSAASLYKIADNGDEKIAETPSYLGTENFYYPNDISISANKGSAVKLRTTVTSYTKDNPEGTTSDCTNLNLCAYKDGDETPWDEYKNEYVSLSLDNGVAVISDNGTWTQDDPSSDDPCLDFNGCIILNDSFRFPFHIKFNGTATPSGTPEPSPSTPPAITGKPTITAAPTTGAVATATPVPTETVSPTPTAPADVTETPTATPPAAVTETPTATPPTAVTETPIATPPTTIVKNPDGSSTETTTSTVKKQDGTTIQTTETVYKDARGKMISTSIKSTISAGSQDKKGSAIVNVIKNAKGTITSATAKISSKLPSEKKTAVIHGSLIKQITEAAGTDNVRISVKNKDASNPYTVTANTADLTAGKKLNIVLKKSSGAYALVNARLYTVTKNGDIFATITGNKTYEFINSSQMKKLDQKILQTIKVKKPSKTIKKAKTAKMALKNTLDMDNVRSIKYTVSKKSVATVTKKGIVKAKRSGTAVVRAKVTLKNGRTKTVKMKINVKK